MAVLQFSSGGMGLRNAERLRPMAYWASWADTLPVVWRRHPGIVDYMVLSLLQSIGGFHLEAATAMAKRAQQDSGEGCHSQITTYDEFDRKNAFDRVFFSFYKPGGDFVWTS